MRTGRLIVCLLFVSVASRALAVPDEKQSGPPSASAQQAIANIVKPPGLVVELFADEPMLANPVAFAIDEKGRVFVAESFRQDHGVEDNRHHTYWLLDDLASTTVEDRLAKYEKWAAAGKKPMSWYTETVDRVRLLTDTDGDGKADRSHLFSRDFNHPLDGTGAGLLAFEGTIYYTNIPHLWAMRDKDNDGVADEHESLSHGYGVRDALRGHDLHGLALGPDGKLYFSVGDRGYNVTTREGRRLNDPLDGGGRGAVFRCNLDGSDLEVFATGLRNPQELAFDQYGNLFTVDNNSDSGDRARLVYIVEGGDSGWSMSFQTMEGDYQRGPFNHEKHWHTQHAGQPAWIIPPVAHITSGPSGMTYYPGVGLPERYDHHFFIVDFTGSPTNSGIQSFTVTPKGAGFEIADAHQFLSGVLATDVDFGYDGKMYVSDWVEGWTGTGTGRILTVFDPERVASPQVQSVSGRVNFHNAFTLDHPMSRCLEHPDMRVRLRYQYRLVNEGRGDEFHRVLRESKETLARIHAVWGLGQLKQFAAVEAAMDDKDEDVRSQCARTLGDIGEATPIGLSKLVGLLNDPSPRVVYHAAISLGKLKHKPALPAVLNLLRENADQDVYLRHAGMMALYWIADGSTLAPYINDPSPAVRMGVLLALRRQQDARVAQFLNDIEPLIVVEAARAIYDLQMTEAMPALAAIIERMPVMTGLDETQSIFALHRRVLNTHRRLGEPSNIAALAKYASQGHQPSRMRQEAVEILAELAEPNPRDRVLGYHRPLSPRDKAQVAATLAPLIPAMLAGSGGELQAAVTSLAGGYGIRLDAGLLAGYVADASQPSATRIASFVALTETAESGVIQRAVATALASNDPLLRAEARDYMAVTDPVASLASCEEVLRDGVLAEQQRALMTVAGIQDPRAIEVLTEWVDRLAKGSVPAGLRLDIVEAAASARANALNAKLDAYRVRNPETHKLAMEGGDIRRGQALFVGHPAAQCLRCHAVGGVGGHAGPDLSQVASRLDRAGLLESLLNPSAQIAEGFGTVAVSLQDGQSVAGLLKRETPELLVVQSADGREVEVKKSDITFRSPPLSAMPPMAGLLSPREMRDVVEFLSALK